MPSISITSITPINTSNYLETSQYNAWLVTLLVDNQEQQIRVDSASPFELEYFSAENDLGGNALMNKLVDRLRLLAAI